MDEGFAEPQGLDVTVPLEDWHAALDIIVSPRGTESFVPTRGLLHGLLLRATDTEWSHGQGQLVTGTAETLAMVLSGRPAYLDRLSGAGAPLVRERLGA